MFISNRKEIGADLDVHSEAKDLIEADNSYTCNTIYHVRLQIVNKETNNRTFQFARPQANEKLSTTGKIIEKIRSTIKSKYAQAIDCYSFVFSNSLESLGQKKHIIENTNLNQHQSSAQYMQHSINVHINHGYLSKVPNPNFKQLTFQQVRSLLSFKASSITRLQTPKSLPAHKTNLINYLSAKYKPKSETRISLEAGGVICFVRNLM